MLNSEVVTNLVLLILCYGYILLVILISGKIAVIARISRKSARKFLHVMIGNLPFIIPFFSYNSFPLNFPFLVAAPFILVTFLATPYSPSKRFYEKMKGLSGITEEGHQLGLVFYAVSYTLLALFFSAKPYVIAAGVLPMAYGDASAALVGEKYGKRCFRVFAQKSLEGSAAMFLASYTSLAASLLFFSMLYSLPIVDVLLTALGVAIVAALAESLSPLGFDNLTVPLLGALTFLILSGGGV
ncbi:MAG: phosphatidate cytidylyltransferase [Candidatus Bathyarchaeia archaeon]|jgi:dolichol kinase